MTIFESTKFRHEDELLNTYTVTLDPFGWSFAESVSSNFIKSSTPPLWKHLIAGISKFES